MNTKTHLASSSSSSRSHSFSAQLRRLLPIGLLGASVWLSGCVSEPDSHVVSAPPPPPPGAPAPGTTPVVVTQTTNPSVNRDGTQTVVVTQAPPAAQVEVAKERPSSDHVWVPGYWTWRDGRYGWVAGHWEVPPHSGAVWVAPRFEPVEGAYRFYEGYWN